MSLTATDWRPIETAPRDGKTMVLGYGIVAGEINSPGQDPEMTIIVSTDRTDWPGFDWQVCVTDAYAAWMKATHWMPLPDPPSPDRAGSIDRGTG